MAKEDINQFINFLRNCEHNFKIEVQELEFKLRNTSKDSFYYCSTLKKIHCLNAKREFIKEILKMIRSENEK